MKVKFFILLIISILFVASCDKEKQVEETINLEYNQYIDTNRSDLKLELLFDENQGNMVIDTSGNYVSKEVNYIFTDAVYKPDSTINWRPNSSVSGSSLSFDGNSNYIKYDEFSLDSGSFTIDVFVAPRFFEVCEKDMPAALVAQFDAISKQGFLFGIGRYGELTLQVGFGHSWEELWSGNNKISTYKWSHLTASYNANTGAMMILIDGEIAASKTITSGAIVCSTNPLYVGKNPNYDIFYDNPYSLSMYSGLMDELKIYSKAISAETTKEYHKTFLNENGQYIKTALFEDVWLDSDILNDDPYKPITHASAPQNWMNESHALFYYNGYYHLFYQFSPLGPYWNSISWGHWVSPDLVNWINVKEAVVSNNTNLALNVVCSGDANYDSNGNPVLFITAGNYSDATLHSGDNVAVCRPKDLSDPYLTEWVMDSEYAVLQTPEMGVKGQFRDPQVYKDGDTWYMLVGGSSSKPIGGYALHGTAHVFTTQDDSFDHWIYRGEIYQMAWKGEQWYDGKYGHTWELPNLLPLNYEDGTFSGKYILAFIASLGEAHSDFYYWIGSFDKNTCRFTPDFKVPRVFDLGDQVYPTARMNYDPNTGRLLVNSAISSQRDAYEMINAGWANCLGYIRECYLSADGRNLVVKRIDELDNVIGNELINMTTNNLEEVNLALESIESDSIYMKVTYTPLVAYSNLSLVYKYDPINNSGGVITYDYGNRTINANTTFGGNDSIQRNVTGTAMPNPDGTVTLEIFIDKSVTEIYVCDQNAMTVVMYNQGRDYKFLTEGGIASMSLRVCELNAINRK